MRRQMNEVLEDEGIKWAVHGSYSGFHVFTNPDGEDIAPSTFDAVAFIPAMLSGGRGVWHRAVACAWACWSTASI